MTAAILGLCAVIAFALWLEDRRRRERDADLIGEVRALRRDVQLLSERHIDLPEAWK